MTPDAHASRISAESSDPLGPLPRLIRQQVRLEHRLARGAIGLQFRVALAWVEASFADALNIGAPEVLWRASGLGRPGAIAQLTWPRLATRMAFGIETPLAHALVDHLLGFDRLDAEARLQITPVEWGILTFAVARSLARLTEHPGSFGPWDLILDQVSPNPFRERDSQGPLVTVRWPVQIGTESGSMRLWVAESLVRRWLDVPPTSPTDLDLDLVRGRFGALSSQWRAEAGLVSMPRGLGRLRVGGVLPIDGSRLRGSLASPQGPVDLTLLERDQRLWIPCEPVPLSSGGRLNVLAPPRREPSIRETPAVTIPTDSDSNPPGFAPADVPVTLTVELGRVNLPLAKLADLKPGDVLELGRHSREPVELTSNGRLVARGELVQIDTELGVRVTNVFL
ncbi:MAG: FliM/FliN family flagellar motor switch protein [Isosphaeraceae bacterium]